MLARQLLGYPRLGHDNAGIPNHIERLERTMDVLRDAARPSLQLQAALWRVLAHQELAYDGSITDRAGRRGHAFTLDSAYAGLPARYVFVLVIEPDTGRLLDYESLLTRDAEKLRVRIPAVTEYEVFLAAGNVRRIGGIP